MSEQLYINFDEYIRQGESNSFTYSVAGLAAIHRAIFEGVFKHAGRFRDYDITKKEWVLQGFKVNNNLFEQHSWYFRNALVRANYRNLAKGINYEPQFLVRFFRNLLLGENNELKNRYMHISVAKESHPTSTPQVLK